MALYCRDKVNHCSCREFLLNHDREMRGIVENFEANYHRRMPCALVVTDSPTLDSAILSFAREGGIGGENFVVAVQVDRAKTAEEFVH